MSFTPFEPKIEAGWQDLLSKLDLLDEYNKLVNQTIENYEPKENRFLRNVDEFEEEKLKWLEKLAKIKEKPIFVEMIWGLLPKINTELNNDVGFLRELISAYSHELFSVEKSVDFTKLWLANLSEKYDKSSLPLYYSTSSDTSLNNEHRHQICNNALVFGSLNIIDALMELQKSDFVGINSLQIIFVAHNFMAIEAKVALTKKFHYQANTDDKITIFYSNIKGLYRYKENKKEPLNYGIAEGRAGIIKTLLDNECISGDLIMKMFKYGGLEAVSGAIEGINNLAMEKLEIPEKIIGHSTSGGYYLNKDFYNFEKK